MFQLLPYEGKGGVPTVSIGFSLDPSPDETSTKFSSQMNCWQYMGVLLGVILGEGVLDCEAPGDPVGVRVKDSEGEADADADSSVLHSLSSEVK